MPPARMNETSTLGWVLLFPFVTKKIVGFDFEKSLKDQRETLGRWLLKCQHFDVVIVHAKKAPVALDAGLCKVIVEKCVVFEARVFDLDRREVKNPLQNTKCFLLCQNPRGDKIIDLQEEALGLGAQRRAGSIELNVHQHKLFLRR